MKRNGWLALVLILMAPTLFAQANPIGLPPGKWWRMPKVVERLRLDQEQQQKLDEIFTRSAPDLIDLRAEMEKRALDLRTQLDRDTLDAKAISAAADALSSVRARMFSRELMLMVEMRGVLSDQQWTGLRRALEQRKPGQRDDRRRPQGRAGDGPVPQKKH